MSKVHRPKSSGIVIPQRAKWHQRLLARFIYILLRLVTGTVRCELKDDAGIFTRPRTDAIIYCFWHNRLAMCLKARARYSNNRPGENKTAALVSASKDGGLLSRVLELAGVQPVRGSSSRRGPQALRELVAWGERGYDLTITPDGPRGPCYQVADGVTSLAQLTGLMIVPVAFNLNWKVRVKSWDRFQIPLPFARCEISVGEVIRVPRELSDEQREALRQKLETEMRAISRD